MTLKYIRELEAKHLTINDLIRLLKYKVRLLKQSKKSHEAMKIGLKLYEYGLTIYWDELIKEVL